MGEGLESLRRTWDAVVASFLQGRETRPVPLDEWFRSYRGTGSGAVDTTVFPEPYLGSLAGRPRAAFLALNPGPPAPDFQRPDGIYADEIRSMGSYSAWAATWPYLRPPWETRRPRQRFHQHRRRFMRDWFEDPALAGDDMVAFELYPWHSFSVRGSRMRPDPTIIDRFVLEPIAELGVSVAFAFGTDWFPVIEGLPGRVAARITPGPTYATSAAGRELLVFESDAGSWIVAEKHLGSAGPPRTSEVPAMREAVREVMGS